MFVVIVFLTKTEETKINFLRKSVQSEMKRKIQLKRSLFVGKVVSALIQVLTTF